LKYTLSKQDLVISITCKPNRYYEQKNIYVIGKDHCSSCLYILSSKQKKKRKFIFCLILRLVNKLLLLIFLLEYIRDLLFIDTNETVYNERVSILILINYRKKLNILFYTFFFEWTAIKEFN
jgi:hypothetical protein